MSFAAPIWLGIAGLVVAGVVVAHLITTSQPRRDVLPTARFIPQTAPLTVTRTRRPKDLPLLLARVLAVALFGLALAGAHVPRSAPPRVTLVDYSTAVGDGGERRRQAMAAGEGVVIAFGDTVGPTTLSGALVAAHRATAGRDDRERTELVIVSPITREQVDSATAPLIALWPGPVRVSRVRAAALAGDTSVQIVARGDDPVAAAVAFMPAVAGRARVFRSAMPTATDSAWARDSAGVLVVWPSDPVELTRRAQADTQQGIAAGRNVVIGAFVRAHSPRDGHAVVRWLDGQPAATEAPLAAGCIREVAIPVDAAGDVALRESFRGIVATLTSPCGGARDLAPADLASLLPAGDTRGPRGAGIAPADSGRLTAWLALGALAVLLVEQLLRRGKAA